METTQLFNSRVTKNIERCSLLQGDKQLWVKSFTTSHPFPQPRPLIYLHLGSETK